jgi:hypothetical protein
MAHGAPILWHVASCPLMVAGLSLFSPFFVLCAQIAVHFRGRESIRDI